MFVVRHCQIPAHNNVASCACVVCGQIDLDWVWCDKVSHLRVVWLALVSVGVYGILDLVFDCQAVNTLLRNITDG